MSILVALMGLCVAGLIVTGVYLELAHKAPPDWLKGGVLANLALFALALAGLLFLGVDQVMAQEAAAPAREITVGYGLALLGIGLPTGLAAIAAGIALGPVGSAALAVIAEKPEMFGRTLVYLGLAEGVAIYGLVMSILMLGKL
ncbi:ATPase [Parasulfuritortus cantonensis]|uniref:ATPase n=1 Tax=Parasulfuritortus cantonensis TaxID=2528202 RepID=A0A4R1BL18_9PROT|nr:ATP synthase subunit C [Parasulfuritortus cantonensis]TCJ17997.1 ATPase [Parasulfuritortus cantonensis]